MYKHNSMWVSFHHSLINHGLVSIPIMLLAAVPSSNLWRVVQYFNVMVQLFTVEKVM